MILIEHVIIQPPIFSHIHCVNLWETLKLIINKNMTKIIDFIIIGIATVIVGKSQLWDILKDVSIFLLILFSAEKITSYQVVNSIHFSFQV